MKNALLKLEVLFGDKLDRKKLLYIGMIFLAGAIIGINLAFSYEVALGIGFVGFVIFGILYPTALLLIIFAIRPIVDQFVDVTVVNMGSASLNLQAILGISMVALSLCFIILSVKAFKWRVKLCIPIGLFLLEGLIGLIFSFNILIGISDWFRVASWMLLIPFSAIVFSQRNQSEQFISSCILAGLFCIFIFVLGPIEEIRGISERKGWFYSVHNAALMMLAILPFLLLRILRSKGFSRWFYIGIEISLLVSVFLTFARAAWLGILVQIVTALILGRWRKNIRLFLLICVMILAGLILTYSTQMEMRFDDLLHTSGPYQYRSIGSGRVGFWEDNLRAFWDSNLLEKLLGRGFRSSIFITEIGVGAHNDFIDILSNHGLVGLILYIWVFFMVIRIGKELTRQKNDKDVSLVFWVTVMSYFVVAIANGMVSYVGPMWYVAGFVGFAYAQLHRSFLAKNRIRLPVP